MYIHERNEWPNFTWDSALASEALIRLRYLQGRLIGGMESIGFQFTEETVLKTLTEDIVKSSAIEGEILDQSQVRSSVARHLGIEVVGMVETVDRDIEGVVEMLLDATQKYDQPLTKERLLNWHAELFKNHNNSHSKLHIGSWRSGVVQVVSGQYGKEIVHFEGPAAKRVEHEMELFFKWINDKKDLDPVLKAGIAHLWFVTIHPFGDGNGRIGRAIADLLLARSEKSTRRFYSLSSQIQAERKKYYTILEQTQKGDLDITPWILWFLGSLERAIEKALTTLDLISHKTKFWDFFAKASLNERQRKIINQLLDGFEGKLTSSKWAKLTKCSQDTAHRDIMDLINQGILIKNPEGGRSTSYSLVIP